MPSRRVRRAVAKRIQEHPAPCRNCSAIATHFCSNPYVPSSEAYRGMIYPHLLNRSREEAQSPADRFVDGA